MKENSARTSTRWGAAVSRTVDTGQTIEVAQFGDVKLLAPQELALALYATASVPVAGLSVEWTLGIGTGSTNYTEVFSAPVLDETNQTALVLRRPAKTIQVSARIISVAAPTKQVKITVLVAPTAPTWLTSLDCENERDSL